MSALDLISSWPVPHVGAAIVEVHGTDATVQTAGDTTRAFHLASISKPISAWAALIAVEEGVIDLDQPVGQPGCTIRHLLSHAGGYPMDGHVPVSAPGRRRSYSNTGIEMVADVVATAAGMSFVDYLGEAVLGPLGMTSTELRGSAAHAIWSTVDDMVRFARETIDSQLLSAATVALATSPVFPQLAGVVPAVGRFDPCPWGLGFEIRGDKQPHWTGTRNSSSTFGHFGGAGTFLWVDPGAVDARTLACVALTDRRFEAWAAEALTLWPQFSDAAIDAALGDAPGRPVAG